MRVVSETSEQEVAHARAFPAVEWALRELTANLMRVAAGAGASSLMFRQLPKLLEALQDYREAVGTLPPSWHLDRALDKARGEDLFERQIASRWYVLSAEQDVVVGALRAAASRLMAQHVQVRAGENKMNGGISELLRLRREQEERWAADRKPALRKSTGKPVKRKSVKAPKS